MRNFILSFSADRLLLLLFIILVTAHVYRINAEATGYTSPDSRFYLELAGNLQKGKGFYIINRTTNEPQFFYVWPVGYPVLLYVVAQITSLSLFWSSKVLNFLLLGFNFLILRQLSQRYSFVLASIFCSYTLMEVYSYTWSEAPFITALLFLALLISKPLPLFDKNRYVILLVMTCLFLFLVRYIGAFSLGVIALLSMYNLLRQCKQLAIKLGVASVFLLFLMLLYLSINYYFGNSFTGSGRFEIEREPIQDFVLMLYSGLFNEFLIVRKYRIWGDLLFIFTTLVQVAIVVVIFLRLKTQQSFKGYMKNSFTNSCFGIGLLYLLALIGLRFISHFDDLDYRLLSPFSTLIIAGLMYAIVKLPDNKNTIIAKLLCFGFYLFSLFLNLPKQYLLEKLGYLTF
ncbi:hypothetical protein FVR03_02545 [Pontibacter qinzhouensis]|uniref:Glycosyltransferase RgtA/B/C/D-like domain-containing protein n=1 Tax=Pontibacter qinzhouensis TaxID=2603253 RepID=A0A5C8KDM7_9BACT|nr:hypothetical protein [Pontibacter qinzhouensis]TXK51980.1 hypothetical protein FVR03_02545 [Pontibacter qinzhouensis]